jgi:hypothetical protein
VVVALSEVDLPIEFEALTKAYTESAKTQTLNALVVGQSGTGKTRLLSTCPKPVLLDNFDPGGPKSVDKHIRSGEILVDDFSVDANTNAAEAYRKWDEAFQRKCRDGWFNNIATYAIDSSTTWIRAMLAYAVSKNPKAQASGLPSIQDYGVCGKTMLDILGIILNLPCHFLLTGHLVEDIEESTGELIIRIAAFKMLRTGVPPMFDEIYVSKVKITSKEPKYYLQTVNDGRFVAKSRWNSEGKLAMEEVPDIKGILEKVGLPFEDKEVKK